MSDRAGALPLARLAAVATATLLLAIASCGSDEEFRATGGASGAAAAPDARDATTGGESGGDTAGGSGGAGAGGHAGSGGASGADGAPDAGAGGAGGADDAPDAFDSGQDETDADAPEVLDAGSDAPDASAETGDSSIDASADGLPDAIVTDVASPDGAADAGLVEVAYVVSGQADQAVDVGGFQLFPGAPGQSNPYLAKVLEGRVEWAVEAKSAASVSATALAVERSSGVVHWAIRGDTDPVILGAVGGPGTALAPTDSGSTWVASYDGSGQVRWGRRFASASSDSWQDIHVAGLVAETGGVRLAGSIWYPRDPVFAADERGVGGVALQIPDAGAVAFAARLNESGDFLPTSLLVGTTPSNCSLCGGWLFGLAMSSAAAPTGTRYAVGGNNTHTQILQYALGTNTPTPAPIAPGPLDVDGWIGVVDEPSGGAPTTAWAYQIGRPWPTNAVEGQDEVNVCSFLPGGSDVIVSGWSYSPGVVSFYHAGGARTLDVDALSGWVARYAADGSEVAWAREFASGVLSSHLAVDAHTLLVGGSASGHAVFGDGGAGAVVYDFPSGGVGLFAASLDAETGTPRWVSVIQTGDRSSIPVLMSAGSDVAAIVGLVDGATFDPGGPSEQLVTGTGEVVVGVARFAMQDGRFRSFTEAFRTPKPSGFYGNVILAAAAK